MSRRAGNGTVQLLEFEYVDLHNARRNYLKLLRGIDMKSFLRIATILAAFQSLAIAGDQPEAVKVQVWEVCQSFFGLGSKLGGDPEWKSSMGCSNSGLKPIYELVPIVRTPIGETVRVAVGDLVYQEDLGFKVFDADLATPATLSGGDTLRTLPAGTVLRKHSIPKGSAYCWFDVRDFTKDEMKIYKIRTSVIGPPPFEAICLQDANQDGVFETGYHRKRGDLRFKKETVEFGYTASVGILSPLSPGGGFGFPDAGEPLASRYVFLDIATDRIGLSVQSARGGAPPAYFTAPIIGGTAEVDVHGLEFVFTSIGSDHIEYRVNGMLDPWVELN